VTFIRLGVKLEKTKLQLYLPPDDYIYLYNYAVSKGKKNLSQAVSDILVEYRRFKAVAMNLQKQIEIEYVKANPRTENERIIDKIHGKGTKVDKNKNK
jgi:hypothetical protein